MIGILIAVLLSLQSAPVQQTNDRRTWYQAYADAQKAIQDQNWQKAIADLQIAAQRGAPKPGRNVNFYGDVFRDYNPDYYLGLAFTNLQRFGEANAAFERVAQAKLIEQRDATFTEFTRQATNVKGILAKLATQASPPTTQANAGRNPGTVQPPTTQTAAASPPSNPSIGGLPAANQPVAQKADNVEQTARPPVQDSKSPPAQARPNPIARPNTQARPNAAVAPSVVAPVLSNDRAAIIRFFSGDYEGAAAVLAAAASGPTASPRAYFYLACSQAALILTGKAPRSAIDEARGHLALAADTGQFASDKILISPRIQQMLGMQP